MKQIKSGTIFLVAVLLFFTFCLGMYLGRQSGSGELLLCTERTAPAQESEEETLTAAEKMSEDAEAAGQNTESLSGPVNINTACEEQLTALPGIGETLARRIVDYREVHGAYRSVEDLKNVSGIGDKKLEGLLEYVTVEEENENTGSR